MPARKSMGKRGRPRKYPLPEPVEEPEVFEPEETEVEEDPLDVEEIAFPPLQALVPPKAIRPGVEWAYVRGQNIEFFKKEGWRLHPLASSFELVGESWVVICRGEPILCSDAFIPRIFSEDLAA